ncbi:MAG: hypothetical protein E6K70_01015 [Planctomycetota bacterium]|nr:MAG: hypothetical protein E6K70_01015 [Planctomycetota bacterium]
MFASLVLEREPLYWRDIPTILQTWVLVLGGFSAAILLIWLVARLFRRPARRVVVRRPFPQRLFLGTTPTSSTPGQAYVAWPAWQVATLRLAIFGMFAGYILWAVLMAPVAISALVAWMEGGTRLSPPLGSRALLRFSLLAASACAFLGVALPFLADLLTGRWSGRRIWALARLSFKEAVRRKVLWVFSAFLLIALFGSWFMPYKYEDQVRNYVAVVYFASAVLFLLVASLLAAFSLPADMRNQTIHTIVTKPVERFEILLGRFLGYGFLMSLVLAVITAVGLLYLIREIDPDAQFESMRARVPVYGDNLYFRGKEGLSDTGINVGREWGYRNYIAGSPGSSHRAVWLFNNLPRDLAARPFNATVPCEFGFDIFRTLKGEEGKGVFCSFAFETRNWDPSLESDYRKAKDRAKETLQLADRSELIKKATQDIRGDQPRDEEIKAFLDDRKANAAGRLIDRLLAEKFGIFEVSNKEIVDYHTQYIDLPVTLFKNSQARPSERPNTPRPPEEERGDLVVLVKCESGGQYVGMAKHDLYILDAEGTFAWNFFKGAIGLWMRLCMVIAIAVTCSTYLSGVISWLTTGIIYVAGIFQEYIRSIVENTNPEGGPILSMVRLINREGLAGSVDQTPGGNIAQGTDVVYRGILRIFLFMFPDVNRLDWTDFVAEGFNIGGMNMILLHLLVLLGYLLPCALVAYYLMKSREVAA